MNKSTILKSAYRVLGRATLAAGLLAGVTAIPASGAEFIPIENEELLIARPGTITTVGEVQVDPANVGALCRLTVVTENGASIHYGNNLIVTTGDQQAVIEDVEATADQTTDLSVELTVGETISFGLEMGPDWVSSLGFGLEIDCTLPQPVVIVDKKRVFASFAIHCLEPLYNILTSVQLSRNIVPSLFSRVDVDHQDRDH